MHLIQESHLTVLILLVDYNFLVCISKMGGESYDIMAKKREMTYKGEYKDIRDNSNIQLSTDKGPSGQKPESSKTPSNAISPVLPFPRSASKMMLLGVPTPRYS